MFASSLGAESAAIEEAVAKTAWKQQRREQLEDSKEQDLLNGCIRFSLRKVRWVRYLYVFG